MSLAKAAIAFVLIAIPSMCLSAPKPCTELLSEIREKIARNGVRSFSLQSIMKGATYTGKIVGSCDGGTKWIIYKKEG